jgi:transcriptional regulator with XRE-family HTH domain
MANENLKNALQKAGVTAEEFADIIKVDPKSVLRWLTGSTKPYPRNRAAIARALDLTEHDLWPDHTPATISAGAAASDGAASDVTETWAHASDENAPDPVSFIAVADGAIELLDNGRGIEMDGALIAAVIEQADGGRKVRLITSLPKPRLQPLIGRGKIDVRVIDGTSGHSLIRVGEAMLFTFDLAGEGEHPPPLLKLQRMAAGGLFDRLAGNFQALWDGAEVNLTEPAQLDAYLTNTDEDDLDDDWVVASGSGTPRPPDASPVSPSAAKPELAPRRWPRRPD